MNLIVNEQIILNKARKKWSFPLLRNESGNILEGFNIDVEVSSIYLAITKDTTVSNHKATVGLSHSFGTAHFFCIKKSTPPK